MVPRRSHQASVWSRLCLCSLLIAWTSIASGALQAQAPQRSRFMRDLKYLSSDELQGRGNGTPELDQAADYIAGQFREAGLWGPFQGGYTQEFEVPTGFLIGPDNLVTFFESPDQPVHLRFGEDYYPISYQEGAMTQAAPLVFAGFGISAPELGYDDYAGVDVEGKVVVVYEHEPQEHSQESRFFGSRLTEYATVEYKAGAARQRGALALILLPDTFNHYREPAGIPSGDLLNLDLNVIRLTPDWGEKLIEYAGRDPREVRKKINRDLEPQSFVMGDLQAAVRIDVTVVRDPVQNVIGILPGEEDTALVIGAHYDHLGLGGIHSLAPEETGVVHNGADDNASGVSGMLELARLFSQHRNRHTLIFIAFAGEELGLLGSSFYTEHPVVPLKDTLAMLNLDMIGRSTGDLLIGGVGTAVGFHSILEDIQGETDLHFRFAETPRAPSDHMSFSRHKIPVLFFFSGLHADYHRPTDDWEKIDVERTLEIIRVVQSCLRRLDEVADQLVFVDLNPHENPR